MKRILTLTLLLCFAVTLLKAQGGRRKDEIEAMKAAFITERINLTPAEARGFWPVYNQFEDEIQVLRKRHRMDIMNARANFDNMSEQELERLVDGEIIFRQNELDALKKYHPQFKQLLGARKVALLYKAEEEFKKELIRRIKDRRD